jgi:TonB-dependent starch-binding outer membrane protein SusC
MKRILTLGKIVLLFILFCFLPSNIYAQDHEVTGTVSDASGNPLTGVSIIIKGTTKGTITGPSGEYNITVGDDDILEFSFLGFQTQDLSTKGVTNLNVTMTEEATELEELVVVGYGYSKKSDLTGSVASLDEEDFNKSAGATPEQLIQGRIAGVQITSNNGEPGAGSQIRIRGASTIRAGEQPLYVIDGIPMDMSTSSPDAAKGSGIGGSPATNPLNFINPNDIESIDILKDASAAAIYGSRGANGVILITTKKGSADQSTIEYSGTFSISKLPKKLDVLTAQEWLTLRIDSLGYDEDNEYHYGHETDWQDQVYRTAMSQSHSISLSGGNEKTTYRGSFNYLDQEGIIKKSSMKRYTGRINVTQKAIENKLVIDANLTASHVIENRVPVGTDGFEGDLILNALKTNPTWPVYDSTGAPFQTEAANERNPVAMLDYTTDITRTTRLIGGAAGTLNLYEGLSYKMNIGVDYTSAIRKIDQSQKLSYMRANSGNARINTKELFNFVIEHTLNYSLNFGVNKVSLLGGYSYQYNSQEGYNVEAGGFTTDIIRYTYALEAGDADFTKISAYADTPEELQSFFGRINYNWNEKLLVTATIRRDGSSKFGENRKYGNFPSLAAAYRLSQESFIQNMNVFSDLKVRVGWGQTGNSEIKPDNSKFLLIDDPAAKAIIDNVTITGYKIDKTPQPDLHWETTTSANIGLDFGFFNNRLSGTLDLFRKKTTDLLVEQPTKALSPTASFVSNLDNGYVLNDGIEIGLNGVAVDNSNFGWNINVNFTSIKNVTKKIKEDDESVIPTGKIDGQGLTGAFAQVYANNRSMGTFYLFKIDSIGSANGNAYYVKNPSGSGDSLFFISSALPKFTMGINNSFRYKNFDLSFFFDIVYGNKIFNNTALLLEKSNLRQAANALTDFAYDNTGFSNSTRKSTRYLENGSYMRLSNATLGYNFNLAETGWVKRARVYVTGTNLFVITKYTGYDPDVSSDANLNDVRSIGIDLTSYPKARTFLIGLNVTF